MDEKTRREIFACGTCGQQEDAHKTATGTDPDDLALFESLGGPCTRYVLSDRALQYQTYLSISQRDPAPRYGGPRPKRTPLCDRCGLRHRGRPEDCVISPGRPGGPPESIRNREK